MFMDRTDAGNQLAQKLLRCWKQPPLVLALPRGGVPVALPVSEHLHSSLDILLVRKLGAPERPELAIGAIVDGNPPTAVFNTAILDRLHVDAAYIEAETKAQTLEIKRRRESYRVGKSLPDLRGESVILIDDGVATGATMRAALEGVRAQKPQQIVVAIPVAPSEVVDDLRGRADEVVCLSTPANFEAVGQFYEDFQPVSDREVILILKKAAARRS